MGPQRVAEDEARRIAQPETVKDRQEESIHARITQEPAAPARVGVKSVAAVLNVKATAEVDATQGERQQPRRTTRGSQVGKYVFFVV